MGRRVGPRYGKRAAERQRVSCDGKDALSFHVAKRRAKAGRRKLHQHIREYRCLHCRGWHVGHFVSREIRGVQGQGDGE